MVRTKVTRGHQPPQSSGDNMSFLRSTLDKSRHDREFLLWVELEMRCFVKDRWATHCTFPPMSSYHRMMVYRMAAYFGLAHCLDFGGVCVTVIKTRNTKLPTRRLMDYSKSGCIETQTKQLGDKIKNEDTKQKSKQLEDKIKNEDTKQQSKQLEDKVKTEDTEMTVKQLRDDTQRRLRRKQKREEKKKRRQDEKSRKSSLRFQSSGAEKEKESEDKDEVEDENEVDELVLLSDPTAVIVDVGSSDDEDTEEVGQFHVELNNNENKSEENKETLDEEIIAGDNTKRGGDDGPDVSANKDRIEVNEAPVEGLERPDTAPEIQTRGQRLKKCILM